MLAIVVAVVAAFIYTGSVAVQQLGNIQADRKAGSLVARLVTTPLWLLGFTLGLVGFGLHFLALGLGSLVEVQIAQTSQIVFMLPFSAWTSHKPLEAREYLGTALVTVGLVGSVVFGQVDEGLGSPAARDWTIAVALSVGVIVALSVAARLARPFAAALLGVAAGIGYGLMAALMKAVTTVIEDDGLVAAASAWELYALVAVGFGAISLQQLALRAGHLSAALSAISVGTPVASTVLGLTIFGEAFTTSGFGWVVFVTSVVLAIGGVTVLARSPVIAAAALTGVDGGPSPDRQG